jgi:DNA-binding winged helix-turn-helix (wHTH) protein
MHRNGLKEPIMVNWNNTFQFDLQQLRLTNLLTGRHCALTRNEGALLQALIDGISSKHDLINEVWTRHHAVVTENSYYQLVSLLRKSFASIDLPGAIVTLPRKGISLAHTVPVEEAVGEGAADSAIPGVPGVRRVPGAQASVAGGASCATAGGIDGVSGIGETSEGSDLIGIAPGPATGPVPGPAPRLPRRWVISAVTLGCVALVVALGMAVHHKQKDRPSQSGAASEPVSFASPPPSTIESGDTTIRYSKMPAHTALRIWRDVQARVEIPPEQRRRVHITQHRNRYAVLACSEPLDPQDVRCLTVTVPD